MAASSGGLLKRHVVEEHALAVAEHGVRDEHPLAQLAALELPYEVAARDEARDVYRVAEKVVHDGHDPSYYLSTFFMSCL